MSRPNHLNCVNTAEGIRRINENQERYDRNPDAYEAEERQAEEDRQREQDEIDRGRWAEQERE